MAVTGVQDGFELDDHGILRDSFTSDFHVDEDGILHDDLELFKQAVTTAGQGTDSGFSGDKQSSTTSTLRHLHASFDEDLAPIGDESVNISDFEASRDDLDSVEGELEDDKQSKKYGGGAKALETSGGGQQQTFKAANQHGGSLSNSSKAAKSGGQSLFTEEYYQQLRDLGVLVDGADFSREESQNDLEELELQLSHDHAEGDDSNRDLIGEYLQDQYEAKQREQGERKERSKGRGGRFPSSQGPVSQGSSLPADTGQSVSDIGTEDMDMVFAESQQTADDDEIFLINHHLLRGSSHIQAEKLPTTPSDLDSRPNSITSGVQSPHSSNRRQSSRRMVSPAGSGAHDFKTSRSGASTPHKARPDSAVSFMSTASESVRPQSGASTSAKSSMSKARSQESFFEHNRQQGKGGEKLSKRILPTPNTPETKQSMRVRNKSKSVNNIANKSAPVKPTHMTISEITRITMDETGDGAGEGPMSARSGAQDKSEGELTTQLKQESSKRKQATELVQQLQKEYDTLLSKYALAELTIDQMRLGARITVHADSPTPSSVQSGVMSPSFGAHKAQMLQLPAPSGQRASVGSFSMLTGDVASQTSMQVQAGEPHIRLSASLDTALTGVRSSLDAGIQLQGAGADLEDRGSARNSMTTETMTQSIQTQAVSLNDRLDQFQTLMENRQLTLEEQEKAFDNIRTDHEKLRRSYLQAKEDYNVLRRSGASFPEGDFDSNKELEGQLFRLGMKFDEVHEKVDSDLQHQSTRRQPFQTSRLAQQQLHDEVDHVDQGMEQNSENGSQSADVEMEKRAQQLHEEYRALIDRHRRLQQMTPTVETEKETDNLVRKLKGVCNEMPDMFRLSPEVQERWEKLRRRDERRSPVIHGGLEGAVGGSRHGRPSSGASGSKTHGRPPKGNHSASPHPHNRRSSHTSHRNDDSFHRTPSSLSDSYSSLASPRDLNSSTAVLRSSATPSPQFRDRQASLSSLDGAAAPRGGGDNYDARINRPRRHKHDFRDPKPSKRTDRNSYSSLADSGLSDQEHRDRHHDDALAQLPGPGKMKQLTHQRTDNDMDSGFVGSVVSTQSGQLPPPDPRRPENTLRLREPASADRSHNRSRRDSSASSSTVASSRKDSSGKQQSRHHSRSSASTATQQYSFDRSYDAELDESTFSQLRDQDARPRDVQPKQPASKPTQPSERARQVPDSPRQGFDRSKSARQEGEAKTKRKGEEAVSLSQSMGSERSQSDSMQDDETLEDVSEEISDVSTPRQMESSVDIEPSQNSTQPRQASPTLSLPTTPRPPTPYSREEKEEAKEATVSQQATSQSEAVRTQSTGPPADKGEHKKVPQLQQQQQSVEPAPLSQEPLQRPESRGEPTTDLFHTRPKQKRQDERSHDGDSVISVGSSRSKSRHGRRRSRDVVDGVKGEDRGVGSDIEIGSDVTRVSSVHSGRLRALQEEIEKLKVGVQQAHDKASERPEPTPLPPPPPQQEGPEYYDPFDDPYGFMRMPRRRANSFSGGRVREFDEWYWALPNERRHNDEDIPLGYAAADAYNLHYQAKSPEAARERLRRRRRHGERIASERGQKAAANGAPAELMPMAATEVPHQSAAPPTPGAVPRQAAVASHQLPSNDSQAAYSYFVPVGRGIQPQDPNPNSNPYRQHTTPLSTSQPNLAATLAGVEPARYHHCGPDRTATAPWYTIRRSQQPASSYSAQGYPQPVNMYQQRTAQAQPTTSYYSSYASSGSSTPVQNGTAYWTELCPLCGGSGAHVHEEDSQSLSSYEHWGRHRKRSRSVPRPHHFYLKRSGSRGYHVREHWESDSEGSDLEFAGEHRRSRSWSRSKHHSQARPSSSRRSSRHHRRHRHRRRERLGSVENVDLDESLMLSEDISRLTKRMLGTVRGELNHHQDRKEFGSSYW